MSGGQIILILTLSLSQCGAEEPWGEMDEVEGRREQEDSHGAMK